MGKKEVDEFLVQHLTTEMLDPGRQEELRQIVTQSPPSFRQTVEQQELGMDGINRNEAGEYEQRGKAPDPSTPLRISCRMMSNLETAGPLREGHP